MAPAGRRAAIAVVIPGNHGCFRRERLRRPAPAPRRGDLGIAPVRNAAASATPGAVRRAPSRRVAAGCWNPRCGPRRPAPRPRRDAFARPERWLLEDRRPVGIQRGDDSASIFRGALPRANQRGHAVLEDRVAQCRRERRLDVGACRGEGGAASSTDGGGGAAAARKVQFGARHAEVPRRRPSRRDETIIGIVL